ncbi:MAG: Asp-tRNA(Asn)/Glu-tRNA(Gln) amidotransferase subunit GatC [Gemmatimonadales bacterium]|nr:Asp-tRNA(Asn)/Glu-tRNA(Gln) amidotransferase subunit GatC [Gemmatimonadales bacterium]
MSVTAAEVERVAKLAELAVDPKDLPALTAQMNAIVDFVAQLTELGDLGGATPYIAGPERTPLREDVVRPARMARRPAEIAPDFEEGFFVVPKLGAMESSA